MKKCDEDTALAILFSNTKRKKRIDDLFTIAKACEYLVSLKKYGSQGAVAKKIGLSTEMIRQFLAVLKLPREVQKMFSSRKIDSVDVAKELLALNDPAKQVVAAKALAGSLSKDVRDIKRLIKESKLSAGEAKKVVLDAKPKGLHIFVMDFDDETYGAIRKQAKDMKIEPVELIRGIVTNWLKQTAKKSVQ